MNILQSIIGKIFPHPAVADLAVKQKPQSKKQEGPVDVAAVLNALAKKSTQQLNWRTSIVDLLKLLSLDSSIHMRQGLARELGYTGDMSDSATMNIWLQHQVMQKLAENGGKVPEELKH